MERLFFCVHRRAYVDDLASWCADMKGNLGKLGPGIFAKDLVTVVDARLVDVNALAIRSRKRDAVVTRYVQVDGHGQLEHLG